MRSTSNIEPSNNKYMKDKTKLIKITLQHPELSHVKPPTKHAAEIMIQNLHKAGKEKQ